MACEDGEDELLTIISISSHRILVVWSYSLEEVESNDTLESKEFEQDLML
jgi:hypothetical protein